MKRRSLLTGMAAVAATIGTSDWLRYFNRWGVPGTSKLHGIAAASNVGAQPHFLMYWFQEGGWEGYSCFNPFESVNDATRNIAQGTLNPNPSWSDHFYRARGYGSGDKALPKTEGNIRYGYLAEQGKSLFPDMAVVSSHKGDGFHSRSRLRYHYGDYVNLRKVREPDERTVMQAFAEEYGASYLMPNVSWHRWLADGELSLDDYPEGTGYEGKLGPSYAQTIYGRTPANFRARFQAIKDAASTSARDERIQGFVDNLHNNFLAEKNGPSTTAFASALEIHRNLVNNGQNIEPAAMFSNMQLKERFNIKPGDEDTVDVTISGNTRSKNTPKTNVQAMMAYELMTKGLSIGFWIENQRPRFYDTHHKREQVMDRNGKNDQLKKINEALWNPLKVLVDLLKTTEYGNSGNSYFDTTTIVLASEMGRNIRGGVQSILDNNTLSSTDKYDEIQKQDVSAHWQTNSVAFLGGTVKGNRQYGAVGTVNGKPIPIMPDGSLDPAYNLTGSKKAGRDTSGIISTAGNVYSTALHLSGITGKRGRNALPALTYIKK